MKDKRKFKRAQKFFAVNIVSVDAEGKHLKFDAIRNNPKFCDESGLDFSPEGMKIMCSKPLPKESKIQMKMLIPDEANLNLIRVNGEIRWFKQIKGVHKKYFVIGVQFRDISPDDKEKLIRLWKKYK
jgi:c-di-GMP-binding flagellar brake protein YcgR